MVAYELIQELKETGLFHKAVNKGIIPITYMDYAQIYEVYLRNQDRSTSKMEAYEHTAEDCQVSVRTVRVIVKKMEN